MITTPWILTLSAPNFGAKLPQHGGTWHPAIGPAEFDLSSQNDSIVAALSEQLRARILCDPGSDDGVRVPQHGGIWQPTIGPVEFDLGSQYKSQSCNRHDTVSGEELVPGRF